MRTPRAKRKKIPRDPENDYTPDAAEARRTFLRAQTEAGLEHVSRYSFDPSILPGNIEHFTGGGCPESRRTSVAAPVIIMPLSGPHSGLRH